MADTVESSLLKLFFDAFPSPALQKIAELWDLKNDIAELQSSLATAVAAAEDDDVNGGVDDLRFQLRITAYEAEDMLHILTIIGAKLIDDSGRNQRPIRKISLEAVRFVMLGRMCIDDEWSQGAERYRFEDVVSFYVFYGFTCIFRIIM
ncbi:uncharacterized protein LOC133789025 [Humulus lupulus]|uniref:uncharacterized protein LOC133789025 n=1 Tax=Humulus lupulus TaxID=3486 RepID=UPI002B4012E8|nr:uncharacterized protein LOC133789025 [Humulus lupulus]